MRRNQVIQPRTRPAAYQPASAPPRVCARSQRRPRPAAHGLFQPSYTRSKDADWLNRAGILAEAVSFFLIAPEIAGLERLRRAEAGLERLARTMLNRESRASIQLTVTVILLGAFFVAYFWFLQKTDSVIFFSVGAIVFLVHLAVIRRVSQARSERTSHYGIRERFLDVLGLPGLLIFRLLWFAALGLLTAFATCAVRLLAGDNRLRALVFGTGVLLLFGGMAAQFAATF